MRQLGVLPVLGLWAGLCLAGGLYSSLQGYGGRNFAATLTVFCFLFGMMLLFAARGAGESLAAKFGAGGGLLLGAIVYLSFVFYSLGTGTFSLARMGTIAVLVFVPLALAVTAERASAGAWQDLVMVAGVWAFVKFSPSHWLWPFPGARLAYVFTVLAAVSTALASFVLIRRLEGIGDSIGWG